MALCLVTAADPKYRKELFPKLLAILCSAEGNDVPKFGEHLAPAVDAENASGNIDTLEAAQGNLAGSVQKRVARLIKGSRTLAEGPAKATLGDDCHK